MSRSDYVVEASQLNVDSDTIWLDIKAIQRVLAKYDYRQPHLGSLDIYIATFGLTSLPVGCSSETYHAINLYGHIAFGGGGLLVSLELMERLRPLYDECVEWMDEIEAQGGGQC